MGQEKRILIVGNKGQLGTDCASVLCGAAGTDLPEMDIADRSGCFRNLDKLRPAVIVNCAAYTAVDACESDPVCWTVNADGPKHLAEWAVANGAFLVHVSTDYVFDGAKPLFNAYTEADASAPVSEYGRSKLAGEQAILESGAEAAILRTAWLYGAHGKNFLKTMLRLAVQNPQKEIRVVNDQFGSPTWSLTLARQIKAVIGAGICGVFHATSEGHCSWFDLASHFLKRMEVPHRIVPCTTTEYPTPAKRPVNSILENSALKSAEINLFRDWNVELARFVDENRGALCDSVRDKEAVSPARNLA
jgi:dTDP-4-dehydrorhamnose reductase